MTDPKKETENPEIPRIDVTPLLFLPLEELRSLFSDLVPGSVEAVSVARVLHSIAAILAGERDGHTGNRRLCSPGEGNTGRDPKRAVEFLEVAESLDGLGHASDRRHG